MLCNATYNDNKTFGSGFYVLGISSVLVNKRLGTTIVSNLSIGFGHFFYWVSFLFFSGFLSGVGQGGTDYAHATYLLESTS